MKIANDDKCQDSKRKHATAFLQCQLPVDLFINFDKAKLVCSKAECRSSASTKPKFNLSTKSKQINFKLNII